MIKIAESVGENGKNKPVDVIKAITLINNNDCYTGLIEPLPVSGIVDSSLIEAIKSFQANCPAIKAKKPDGKVDPGGKTLTCLNAFKNIDGVWRNYLPKGFDANTFGRFNVDSFIQLYRLQYPAPKLGASAELGLDSLLESLIADSAVTDVRWAAYMLATVKHECANTWQPIEEYGHGAGKEYGKSVLVEGPDHEKYNNAYYGRGYVQLTWDSNYKKMDQALGLAGASSLYLHPENGLLPKIAYSIMSYGMREGSFTSKKLADYLGAAKSDYRGARRIINGQDQATLIAGYAENIEYLLRFCNGI